MGPNIPLIDLQAWRDGNHDQRAALAVQVDQALQDTGFLMIANHGVAPSLKEEVRTAARRFFSLPADVKGRYATVVSGRGWVAPGREANAYYGEVPDAALADLKESYTTGREFATGDAEMDDAWFAPNVWPTEIPDLRDPCTRYAAAMQLLYLELLEMCAAALGLAPDWFVQRSLSSPHTFNINRYPALAETGAPLPGQFRIGAHTDWGVITILDRQPGYGGLQVQGADGLWVDAPYEPDAFTINIGDLLARWTGDRWRSTRHRVLPPSPEAPSEELISLILFHEADVNTVVESFPPPVGGEGRYPPVSAADYLRERSNAATVA